MSSSTVRPFRFGFTGGVSSKREKLLSSARHVEELFHGDGGLVLRGVEAGDLVVGHGERQSLQGGGDERRRKGVLVDPVVVEDRTERLDLHPASRAGERGELRLDRGAVVCRRRNRQPAPKSPPAAGGCAR